MLKLDTTTPKLITDSTLHNYQNNDKIVSHSITTLIG